MSENDTPLADMAPAPRKPRIALMGEFSAGKSTLSNLLIGSSPLPTKVTATQLPPVWLTYGEPGAEREDFEGQVHPVDLNHLEQVVATETRMIRITQQSEFLKRCDLIDMPGISDPNMSAELWQSVVEEADAVLWCTHATQAWRQSEAATWDDMPEKFFDHSMLLVTRFDKLLTDKDRTRVMRRVEHETGGMFSGVYPISLLEALEARSDSAKWRDSGAKVVVDRLKRLIETLSAQLGFVPEDNDTPAFAVVSDDVAAVDAAPRSPVMPRRVRVEPRKDAPLRLEEPAAEPSNVTPLTLDSSMQVH